MNKLLEKRVGFLLTFILLLPTLVLAQTTSEWTSIILSTILGELPRPCQGDIGTPECIQCLGYVKFIPLIFFTTLFFFVFYLVVQQAIPAGRGAGFEATQYRVATVLGLVLAIILLHAISIEGLLKQLIMWLGMGMFVLGLILFRSIARVTGALMILELIILFVLFIVIGSYIFSLLNPVIQGWHQMCV